MRHFPKTLLWLAAPFFLLVPAASPARAQTLTNVAGNCIAGYTANAAPATQASLWLPDDLAFDSHGNYYIADAGSNTIREVNIATGILTPFAGVLNSAGNPSAGNGGPATQATLDYPSGLVFDSSNNLYIADYYGGQVRKIDASTGIISTYAGTGTPGYLGDGGPATQAELANPAMVRFDPTGRYLAISDEGNSTVREVDTTTGFIRTVAGNGTAGYSGNGGPATLAHLNQPDGLAFDSSGNLFVGDNINGAIRKVDVTTGLISTVAGTGVTGYSGDNGPATLAQLGDDLGSLNFTCDGSLILTDCLNDRVRRVDKTTGTITTVIGTGNAPATCPASGAGVLSTNLAIPQALVFDSSGNLYLVEYGNELVQEVTGGLCPSAPTPTPSFSSSNCNTIETYSYPNPAAGSPMNIFFVLCEGGSVRIQVYNSAAELVATYNTNGSAGPNVYPANITGFSHGVYYYFVIFNGSSGEKKSKPTKFALTRSQ